MSSGGAYQLVSNKGIQDRLLYNTDMLNEIIHKYKARKMKDAILKFPNLTRQQLCDKFDNFDPPLEFIEQSHILHINSKFKPFVHIAREYSKTLSNQSNSLLGSRCSFTIPVIGEYINDSVVHLRLTGLKALNAIDKVKYVEFLGHRIIKNVRLTIGNNVIDEYTSNAYNAHWQFDVPVNKEDGYLRGVGQETPKQGYVTADPINDEHREYRWFGTGPQTYKINHDDVELWIPLLFWFNNIKTALPNFTLNSQQTVVELEFESVDNIVAVADYGGGGLFTPPVISRSELYVNHIFLIPEILELVSNKFSFQLVRVHKEFTQKILSNSNTIKLQQLKWPVESIYFTFKPNANLKHSQKWHRNTLVKERTVSVPVLNAGDLNSASVIYYDEYEPIKSLELTSQNNILFPQAPASFFNNYVPYRFGDKLKTPKDLGNYMINFNENPGEYQPSGHFNISRSRELYLNYLSNLDPDTNSDIIDINNPCLLTVQARCINFLIIKDGNAVLRYAT